MFRQLLNSAGGAYISLPLLLQPLHDRIHAPDLASRQPNSVEPWTDHVYGALRDSDATVRAAVLATLAHLALNDMIKARGGGVAEVALLVVDGDDTIRRRARAFFEELHKKSTAQSSPIYNLLPDVVSRLSAARRGPARRFVAVLHRGNQLHRRRHARPQALPQRPRLVVGAIARLDERRGLAEGRQVAAKGASALARAPPASTEPLDPGAADAARGERRRPTDLAVAPRVRRPAPLGPQPQRVGLVLAARRAAHQALAEACKDLARQHPRHRRVIEPRRRRLQRRAHHG
mgnify:CR=1 FL=1